MLIDGLRDHIAEDHDRTREDAEHHEQVVILITRTFIRERTDTRIGKYCLDDIRAAEHVRYGNRHDAQIRRQNISQTVAKQDFFLPKSFGFCEQHII